MDIIYKFAVWYKAVSDKFFAMIGINAETTDGIVIIVIAAVALHLGGDFFNRFAETIQKET